MAALNNNRWRDNGSSHRWCRCRCRWQCKWQMVKWKCLPLPLLLLLLLPLHWVSLLSWHFMTVWQLFSHFSKWFQYFFLFQSISFMCNKLFTPTTQGQSQFFSTDKKRLEWKYAFNITCYITNRYFFSFTQYMYIHIHVFLLNMYFGFLFL